MVLVSIAICKKSLHAIIKCLLVYPLAPCNKARNWPKIWTGCVLLKAQLWVTPWASRDLLAVLTTASSLGRVEISVNIFLARFIIAWRRVDFLSVDFTSLSLKRNKEMSLTAYDFEGACFWNFCFTANLQEIVNPETSCILKPPISSIHVIANCECQLVMSKERKNC